MGRYIFIQGLLALGAAGYGIGLLTGAVESAQLGRGGEIATGVLAIVAGCIFAAVGVWIFVYSRRAGHETDK